ncbi:MAG: iron-containing alcohol dehydrogenase [Acidimicrobiia bacterium]
MNPGPLVVDSPDALGLLSDQIETHRRAGPTVVLTDGTPKFLAGDDHNLMDLVADMLPDAIVTVLGHGEGLLLVDETTVSAAVAAGAGAGCLVSIGSGTLTDLGKLVSHQNGVPLVAVPTAASVNGYSDHLAVVLRAGAKRTVPAASPAVLVVDHRVLAGAPVTMSRAGLGETVGAIVAAADWQLAATVGADPSFDADIVRSYRRPAAELIELAAGIDGRRPETLAALFRLLTGAGLAMRQVGKTAPLSGTEHAVSHLLDMVAGRDHGLHGAQVGVAAVVAACLWEVALDSLNVDSGVIPDDRILAESLTGALTRLGAAAVEECWSDYRVKPAHWRSTPPDWRTLAMIRDEAGAWSGSPAEMSAALAKAGAPTRFSDLDPPVDPATARWAVLNAHLLRSRFTILDLVVFTGGDIAQVVDDALAKASEVGGGL